MKKNLLGMILVICMVVGFMPMTAQASYSLNVSSALAGQLKECILLTAPAKITYRQGVEPFNPKDIVVQCIFTDGTTQNLGYQQLEFFAGARGMADCNSGNFIKDGYRFVEPGAKDLIIRVGDMQTRIPFTVTPILTKPVSRVDIVQAPEAMNYKVGEAFFIGEYAAQCVYADGTVENFDGASLIITANGTRIYDGYRFKEAGNKKVVVSLGDYQTDFTMTVSK